jgi:hypothetical protein
LADPVFTKDFLKDLVLSVKKIKNCQTSGQVSFFFFENFKLGSQPTDLKVPVLRNLSTIGCSRWFTQTGYDIFFPNHKIMVKT